MNNMDSAIYNYNGKMWSPCPTTSDSNSFFHSAFGTQDNQEQVYFDKHVQFRRMRWATFLTYFKNETMPPCLVDIMRKCLSTNECKHASIDDKENLEKYICEITALERHVTIDEINVLATLENIKIVVFSNKRPEPIIQVKPIPHILGNYPNVERYKNEVILYLDGDTFSRLKPINEDPISKFDKVIVKNKIKKEDSARSKNYFDKYKKYGSAGSKGVQYQVNLLVVVLLNAFKNLKEWKLSTENEDAGKFDDIVLEWPQGSIFIQSKHKESKKKKITLEDLTSTNSKNDDFSLPKYYLSYQLIKKKFNVDNVIICTNADVHERALKHLDRQEAHSDSVLYYEDSNYVFYTLNEKILSELKENVKSYYQQNFKNKGIEESEINDENLKNFKEHLQLYFNYPSLKHIGKNIDKLLSSIKCCSNSRGKIFSSELYSKVMNWFQREEGMYLTELHTKAIFSEIWTDKFCQVLEQYNVFFQINNFNFQDTQQIFHVTSRGGFSLPVIKIYRAVQNEKILFVNSDDEVEIQKQIVDAFELPQFIYLIVILPQTTIDFITLEMYGKLKNVLQGRTYKKIIVVAGDNDKLWQQTGMNCDTFFDDTSEIFHDLHPATQEMLLTKHVVFQGNRVRLEEIMKTQTNQDYAKILNMETLEKLVKGEEIKVGAPLSGVSEEINRYYVSRTFKREFSKTQDQNCNNKERKKSSLCEVQYSNEDNIKNYGGQTWNNEVQEEIFSEEIIYDVADKVILIADSAGMGKSTVLANVSVILKKKNPNLWVIKIDLNSYTTILKDLLQTNRKSIDIVELLASKDATTLLSPLEKSLFRTSRKVVLLLDGVDEIGPDYTELILNMLKQCQEQSNFDKIFVTTRPHMIKEIEAVLQVKPFILQPFTEQNQIDFLSQYWIHNLELKNDKNKEMCKQYAKALINNWMNLDDNDGNHFATVPLQLRMMAEIFQENAKSNESLGWEGCKEYLLGDKVEPDISERMDITKLYGLFIKKKQNIFIEKANPSGNTVTNQLITETFNECLIYHRSLALELILGEDISPVFSSYQRSDESIETKMLKIGIVQKLNEKLQFIHRTFADYFVAECLLTELQRNQTLEFQKFLVDVIFVLPQYTVTRIFFDSFLQNIIDDLPLNHFEQYCSFQQENSLDTYILQSNLVHMLAGENCIAIFQLILNCIHFKIITNKEISTRDFYKTATFDNTFRVLQELTSKAGINIKNEENYVPLHFAAQSGHIEMVKLLVEKGANIHIKTDFHRTVLHLASEDGYLDTIKFFIELGVDYNIRDSNGFTALQVAARYGQTDTVKFFLKLGADCNLRDINGRLPLHVSAQFGHTETVKVLAVHCPDFSSTCRYGRTLQHLCSMNGHLDIVKFLLDLKIDFNVRDIFGLSPLHLAAQYGHLDTVKFLVECDLDINVISSDGSTLLHSASENGHLDIIKYLLQYGVDFSIRDNYGYTALHAAAKCGHLNVVQFLVECGVDYNITDKDYSTPLHSASGNGHLDIIKYLLKLGVNFNTTNNHGCTALHVAAQYGHLDTMKFLVQCDLDFNITNNDNSTALHLACENNYLDAVKYLIEIGVNFNIRNSRGFTALHVAANYGNLDTLKFLVGYGLDFNVVSNDGSTLLHLAGKHNNLNIFKYIIELGIDINVKDDCGFTALEVAAYYGQLKNVQFFVENVLNYNINDSDASALLHFAIAGDHLDTVKFLMELVTDFNIIDSEGFTTLQIAVEYGRTEIVKFLLENGADYNVKNINNRTPLHVSAQFGHLKIVKLLVQYMLNINSTVLKVDFNVRDVLGYTPLHLAAQYGHLETMKFLIKYDLDYNAVGVDGSTPLHLACRRDHLQIVKYLLNLGVDFNIKDNYDFTILQTAVYYGQLDIVKFLLKYGLDVNQVDSSGSTLLHLATEKGNLDTIKYLVKLGVNLDTKDNNGYTILQTAAEYGHLNTLKFLVEHGEDFNVTNKNGFTVLHSAIVSGHLDTIKYCLEIGIESNNRNKTGFTALHIAALDGHLDVIKFLVEYGLDFNVKSNDGYTLLHLASAKGHLATVKFLLELDIDISCRGNDGFTVLHSAVQGGHLDIVRFFVERGLNFNDRTRHGYTLLHLASANGHINIIRYLFELGIDFNIKDNFGFTALHLINNCNELDFFECIIEYGLDINITSSDGLTLLHLASANGYLDAVKSLLEIKADCRIKSNDGFMPLHLAAQWGQLDAVKYFVEYGIDYNITTNSGHTLLHLSSETGELDIVKYLLALGVDCNVINNSGYTALHLAAEAGHLDVVQFLVEMGADLNIKDINGRTALYLAVFEGYLETVQFLMENETDTNKME